MDPIEKNPHLDLEKINLIKIVSHLIVQRESFASHTRHDRRERPLCSHASIH